MHSGVIEDQSGISSVSPPADHTVILEIGGISISFRSASNDFCRLLEKRYIGFVNPSAPPRYTFDVEIAPPPEDSADEDVRVTRLASGWHVQRGDFQAAWDSSSGKGWLRQTENPYSTDTLVRIVHSLSLATEGGFLLHAASVIRDGRAFLFSGVSGVGKTTLSRLAPRDVMLLTDEMSYVRRETNGYRAHGTPFAGDLGRSGEKASAPIRGLFFLHQGPENRAERLDNTDAARKLLRDILFLAHDEDLVERVFHSAVEFVKTVPAYRLTFAPDARVWEIIR
jgi:hypothetical protein